MTAPAVGRRTYALLTDGSTVEIRPAGPQDAMAVREMHAAMSPDNMYLRFFSISARAGEREARRVCREPGPDHEALLAWLSGRLVGVASYEVSGEPGEAEIAFAVPDDMHGRGIATLLLEHLVSLARQRKLKAFTAETLADNAAMLRVFADAGLPVQRRTSNGVVQLTFPLPGGDSDESLDSYLESVARRESRADVASLSHLLQPDSVAVVGASRKPGTVGRAILRNIVSSGYQGRVYAVNPHARTMEGMRCVASVADIPEPVDLAVIALPSTAVPEVAAECGRRGVRGLVVITSDMGSEGSDLLAICRRFGMRLIGPNCFGVSVPETGLNATFAAAHPASGVAGLVVQSGGLGIALLEHLSRLGIGVSSFASVGDKYDVSSNDLLMWWAQDEVTRLAILYVESFGRPRLFARIARRVGHQMPVLTVLAGRSQAGRQARGAHARTSDVAAAATREVTQEALFGQAGVIVTTTYGELIEAAALLACQPLPAGNRIAIVTNADEAGVLTADACGDNGLELAHLAGNTRRRLRRLLPAGAKMTGPVDTTFAADTAAFRACLEEVAADDGVDAVIAVAIPMAICDLRTAVRAAQVSKPLAVVLLDQAESVQLLGPEQASTPAAPPPGPGADGAPAGTTSDGAPAATTDDAAAPSGPPALVAGLPSYAYPEAAARALGHAVGYRAWRDRQQGQVPELPGARADDARELVAGFLARNPDGGWLSHDQAADLVSCYQIPVVATLPARSEQEAVRAAAELGDRVVLKAEVEGLAHKTDAEAVKLDLRTPDEVTGAYRALTASLGDRLRNVQVQPMIADGVEVLIGVIQEPMFGPLVVLGLGGATAEVLGDHAARLTPLTDTDAEELIHAVPGAPLLFGHGAPPVDTGELADTLLRVSRLADDLPEVAELDLNPLIARSDGIHVVDVRVRVSPAEPRDPFLRQLR
ncbi:MAG TPA: GNAT family N-acetyltransferase [Streptosporangiaceae bacterium]|nr:GNAT family N-acetyltransferase [Streptosporangiaceae bacterium]